MKKLDNLAAIIEDVEDLMAARMEKALLGGWTEWKDYKVLTRHTNPFVPMGAMVQVRFQYPNTIMVEVEVRREKKDGWEYLYPELTEWYFPDLEKEEDARKLRQNTSVEMKPY